MERLCRHRVHSSVHYPRDSWVTNVKHQKKLRGVLSFVISSYVGQIEKALSVACM